MSAPSATHASISDYDRAIAALVTAFVSDPFIRWMFPRREAVSSLLPTSTEVLCGTRLRTRGGISFRRL